jgi:hypothetical protein
MPDGSTTTDLSLTYLIDPPPNQDTACWYAPNGAYSCSVNAFGYGHFFIGPAFNCPAVGNWTVQFLYNGAVLWSNQFSLAHNSSGILGISAPLDNQLIDLDQNNYTATSGIPFTASTNTANQINWTATADYNTSGKKYYFVENPPHTSTTTSSKPPTVTSGISIRRWPREGDRADHCQRWQHRSRLRHILCGRDTVV